MKELNHNKSVEPINYPAGNSSAHFKRYLGRYASEITVARAEHPLVICCCAPDNKREERATIHENKFSKMAVTHPRHRCVSNQKTDIIKEQYGE
jgi:hypothetical protein